MKISKKIKVLSGIALLSCTGAAQAILVTYTDLISWQTAVANADLLPEEFNVNSTQQIPVNTVTHTPGFPDATISHFDIFYTTDTNIDETSNDFCNSGGCGGADTLRLAYDFTTPDATTLLQFQFSKPINAFAADFFGVGNNDLRIDVGGDIVNINTLLGTSADGFIGFTSDTAFTSFNFLATGPGGAEVFNIDDVRIVEATTPVPIPAAVWLMGSALMGLIGICRRKKTV